MANEELKNRARWAINYICQDRKLTNITLTALLPGVSVGSLAQYRAARVKPSTLFIKEFCREFDFSESWFISKTGEPFPGARKKYEEVCGPELPAQTSGVCLDAILVKQPPADDFVFIRQVNGKISAGGGLIPDDTADLLCAFRKDWIKRKGGKPDRMSLIKVDGDSMAPTFLTGDLVLVDHTHNNISSQGGIYAITINDEISIKRVQHVFPDKLLVISDNEQYSTQEIPTENVRVNGKIIWFARDLEK